VPLRHRQAHPLRHKVKRARWSTETATWTVEVDKGGEALEFTCNFLFLCGGYYSYVEGYTPDWAGRGELQGRHRPPAEVAGRPRLHAARRSW
jgi:monooxygenase